MTAREQQIQIITLLTSALAYVNEATRIEQRMSHAPHTHPSYQEIQDRLGQLLQTERMIAINLGVQ